VSVAGKVVVVTGAGQGQGAAEARLLAARGARVTALDLGEAPAEDLPGVEYQRLDVTDAAAWKALAADLGGRFGRVDGLVANAGITWRARLAELDAADLARVSEVNVTGTLLGIQALIPLMTGGGSVVVVGSVAALTGHYPVAYTES
jgi:NAD(P)-dependent dehydrogenase (short-subunit alcohol dehydrogenase family)